MIEEYSLDTTLAYMEHIRANAELAVRNLLRTVAARHSETDTAVLHRVDFMDDGTPIGELCRLSLRGSSTAAARPQR